MATPKFNKTDLLRLIQTTDQSFETVKKYLRVNDMDTINELCFDIVKFKEDKNFNMQMIAAMASITLCRAMEEVTKE